MNQWCVLQYFEEVQTKTGASAKADALLKLYDQKTRKLTIQNAFGDVRVRAGSAVVVALALSVPTIRASLALHRRKKAAKKQANAETEAPKC